MPASPRARTPSTESSAVSPRCGRSTSGPDLDPELLQSTLRPTMLRARVLRRRLGRQECLDALTVPQDRDPVGPGQHLLEVVGDEDDRRALGGERAEARQQLLRLRRGQRRRRLVEHQHPCVPVEGTQDLRPLLLTDGELPDERVGIDLEAVTLPVLADLRRGAPDPRPAHERAAGLAEDHVLGDGEGRHEHEVLVHHPDALRDRVLGAAEPAPGGHRSRSGRHRRCGGRRARS